LGKIGWIWADLRQNLGKIEAKFGQIWLDLGKIKTLHPQKHSFSDGYDVRHTLGVIFFLINLPIFFSESEK